MPLIVSQGSGATLATNVLGGAHHQIISPVSVYPLPAGTAFIGLISAASIHGKVDVASALPAGTNYIGLATVNVANTVPVSQSGTWNVGVTGLISLASGTLVGLNAGNNNIGDVDVASIAAGDNNIGNVDLASAIPAGANYIGLATVDIGSIPTHPVTQSGAWNVTSLASGAHIRAYLETGSNFIGGVSIFGAINLSQVTLNPSPNFIGLVTVGNTVTVATHAVTQSGTWNVGLSAGANYVGLATVDIGSIPTVTVNTHAVTQSGNWNVTSLASGAHIRAYLETGDKFIGGVSVFGNLAANLAGNVTLNPGPNYIGLVTSFPAAATTYIGLVSVSGNVAISNTPAVSQSGNWVISSLASGAHINTYLQTAIPAGTNNIGDIDVLSLPALPAGANYIGLATVILGSNPAVTQSGNWNITSLASGAHIRAYLETGSNFIGGVSVFGNLAANLAGNVTLNPSPNFIGLVTVGNTVTVASHAVTNAGTFAVQNNAAIPTGANYIGLATVDIGSIPTLTVNTHAVTQSGNWNITSLASGAHIRAYLETGSNFIGGVSVFGNLNAQLAGNITLNPSPNFIGLVTVGNTVTVASHAVTNAGTFAVQNDAAIPTGANFIGLVTVGNTVTVASHAVTNAGTFAVQNNAATPAGGNFIGLATIVPAYSPVRSLYTSLATVISAAGNATLFVPPNGTRWVLKNISITAQGRGEVEVKSGTATVIPSMSLATTSGYAQYYGESGFPAKAADQAFVVNVLSAATLGVTTLVRFE